MNYSSENLILQNGLIVLTTKDTFFWKYFDDWIVTYKQNEVRPVTLQKYYIANQVIKELWSKVKISDITRELYQQLINLYGKKHEKQTVEDFVHIINQPFRDLKYDGLLDKDPTYRIKIVTTKKVVKNSRKYLEISEMKKLDEFCRKDDGTYTNFIDILLRTGFRYAECLGVTMNDVDFDKHTVSINKTWDYKTDEGFQPTKNSSSVRTIEVDDYTLRCFKRNAVGVNDDEPIFRKAGIRFNSTVNDVLKSIQERYLHLDGLPITVHGLRHTHASFLISNSVSIQSVADRLGHADTITTQETYIHLLRKQKHKDNDIIMKGLAEL